MAKQGKGQAHKPKSAPKTTVKRPNAGNKANKPMKSATK